MLEFPPEFTVPIEFSAKFCRLRLEFRNVDGVCVDFDFDFDCASRGGCQFRWKVGSGVELLQIIAIARLMDYNGTRDY